MNKKIFGLFLLLLLALPFALSDTEEEPNAITRLYLVGNGIAINSQDPMDFVHAKASVGAVRVGTGDANFEAKRLGVLQLDGTVYHLKNIAVEEQEISADVFEKNGPEPIGSIYVTVYEKPGRDVWAGELEVNETLYNVYFIGLKRAFKPVEAAEKIADYCEENPDDNKCTRVRERCAAGEENCKEKIVGFCKENPNNVGCRAVQNEYCMKNASDTRCREFLLGRCQEDPAIVYCIVKKVNDQNVLGVDESEVEDETTEAGEQEEETGKPVVAVRNRWRALIGGDRDKHGCIGSAGYSWCEAKEKCLRIWEEECPETEDGNSSQGNGNGNGSG